MQINTFVGRTYKWRDIIFFISFDISIRSWNTKFVSKNCNSCYDAFIWTNATPSKRSSKLQFINHSVIYLIKIRHFIVLIYYHYTQKSFIMLHNYICYSHSTRKYILYFCVGVEKFRHPTIVCFLIPWHNNWFYIHSILFLVTFFSNHRHTIFTM